MAVGPLHGTHEPPFYVCGSDQWVAGYMEGAVRTGRGAAAAALRVMADLTFDNVIDGESTSRRSAAPRWTSMTRPPARSTRPSPLSGAADVDAACAAAARAFRTWGRTTPAHRAPALLRHRPTRWRRGRTSWSRPRYATPASRSPRSGTTNWPRSSTSSGSSPAPPATLPGAGGGGVRRRLHLDAAPRTGRRVRADHAVELPADDGGLEDRPGARGRATRWCSSRPTPRRRQRRAAGPDRRRVPAAAACSTSSAVTGTPAGRWSTHQTPRLVAVTGSVRAGREIAAAAAADLKRTHLELGGNAPVLVFDDVDVARRRRVAGRDRLLQRRPGLHGADPVPRTRKGS